MAAFTDSTFANGRITLDDNSYVRCFFDRCDIVYGARGKVHLDGCTFQSCSYIFDGAAQDTLLFMTALYKIDPKSIERTIDNIRAGAQPVKPPRATA